VSTPENTPIDLTPLAAAALPVEAEGSWIRAAIARLAKEGK
jgi:hypothetical protein